MVRVEGLLPKQRPLSSWGAEMYDEQQRWIFSAAPTWPGCVSVLGQHAHDKTDRSYFSLVAFRLHPFRWMPLPIDSCAPQNRPAEPPRHLLNVPGLYRRTVLLTKLTGAGQLRERALAADAGRIVIMVAGLHNPLLERNQLSFAVRVRHGLEPWLEFTLQCQVRV
jgi:hypothetical protein